MSNLTVFDPFREMASLRSMMDQVFDSFMTRSSESWRGMDTPSLDLYQTENEVIVKVVLPGVKPEDINLAITNQILNIRAEVKEDKISENATVHIRERSFGTYSRALQLPVPVVADKAKAEFDNGILVLTLPKAEEVRPKTITIKTK